MGGATMWCRRHSGLRSIRSFGRPEPARSCSSFPGRSTPSMRSLSVRAASLPCTTPSGFSDERFAHRTHDDLFVTYTPQGAVVHARLTRMSWWPRQKPLPPADSRDPGAPLIRLEHVSKVFNADDPREKTYALSDVSVDIGAGEYVSISGPSGCGKSTFLSILAMLDTPTSGRYLLKGQPVNSFSAAEKARLRNLEVGLIFQSFNLLGDMSVYENVEYPLSLRNYPPADRKARVEAA